MDIKRKKIKILTSGAITVKGFINGPVLTPYYENIDFIFKLIAGGIDVVEVLEDKTEVKLTVSNFSTDNSVVTPEVNNDEPIIDPVIDEGLPVTTSGYISDVDDSTTIEQYESSATESNTSGNDDITIIASDNIDHEKEVVDMEPSTITTSTSTVNTQKNQYYHNNKNKSYNKNNTRK